MPCCSSEYDGGGYGDDVKVRVKVSAEAFEESNGRDDRGKTRLKQNPMNPTEVKH
eukprot:CAMPEP_0185762872 /NCGR_PEP_ID=MMETSP1174-20130828/21841_1 /TAXON_ID=35687 /ORGANISM="Dictyocha speculum, Strain CCMP1381" /LENGTH=54 /DNA_ID=CAMNT_0028444731 /DNA_START=159 /DNA_END=323 /DNA_ORIENTATION=-